MRALIAALVVVLGVVGAWLGYEIYRETASPSGEPYGVPFNLVDQNGDPIADEPSFDEVTGKLGIYWYHEDGSVLEFHDDYW